MSTQEHKEKLIEAILNSWEKCPELRLGQLIVNSIRNTQLSNAPLFYINDHDLESMIIDFANRIGNQRLP